jgi:hypothetical protein
VIFFTYQKNLSLQALKENEMSDCFIVYSISFFFFTIKKGAEKLDINFSSLILLLPLKLHASLFNVTWLNWQFKFLVYMYDSRGKTNVEARALPGKSIRVCNMFYVVHVLSFGVKDAPCYDGSVLLFSSFINCIDTSFVSKYLFVTSAVKLWLINFFLHNITLE